MALKLSKKKMRLKYKQYCRGLRDNGDASLAVMALTEAGDGDGDDNDSTAAANEDDVDDDDSGVLRTVIGRRRWDDNDVMAMGSQRHAER
jgi:hypothetical protein